MKKLFFHLHRLQINLGKCIQYLLLSYVNNQLCETSETSKEKLSNFSEEHYGGSENYHENAEQIKETEIKHFYTKLPRFSQQLYGFAYSRLIEFPRSNIEYETVTTANFLRNIY